MCAAQLTDHMNVLLVDIQKALKDKQVLPPHHPPASCPWTPPSPPPPHPCLMLAALRLYRRCGQAKTNLKTECLALLRVLFESHPPAVFAASVQVRLPAVGAPRCLPTYPRAAESSQRALL